MASTATAMPPPPAATSTPETAGPRTFVRFFTVASAALARGSRADSTRSGTMPRSAGEANASNAPLTNCRPATSASW